MQNVESDSLLPHSTRREKELLINFSNTEQKLVEQRLTQSFLNQKLKHRTKFGRIKGWFSVLTK